MKKLYLIFLPTLCAFYLNAQNEEKPLDVKIQAPRMSQLIDKLWVDLPTACTVPASATIDQGDETCAGVAMKHFRAIINKCTMTDGFKEALKTEFKIIKLIPVGKAAGLMLDIADLTAKALTANSPEALEADLVKYGFGKVVGDEMVGKLKKLLPEGDVGDVLGNLTKLYYKQLWDKAKQAILPKEEKYECQPETDACKDNIHISIEPYSGDDPMILGLVVFSANGDCQCKLSCSPGTPQPLLKTWSVHGQMELRIQNAQVVDESSWLIFSKKVLQVNLVAGAPSYHVMADCDCSGDSHTSNTTYNENNQNDFFVGVGLINEDAGNRFNTYGLNVAYTHMASAMLGITGDAGLYFGKQDMTNYTKLQILAGASLSTGAGQTKLLFRPHLLAGITNIHSKFENSNDSGPGNTYFSTVLGTDMIMNIGKVKGSLRVGYNPVFAQGSVSHNFRLSAGIIL